MKNEANEIIGKDNVGGLVGSLNNSKIFNDDEKIINGLDLFIKGENNIGGIVGVSNYSIIEKLNIENNQIIGENNNIGGIIGLANINNIIQDNTIDLLKISSNSSDKVFRVATSENSSNIFYNNYANQDMMIKRKNKDVALTDEEMTLKTGNGLSVSPLDENFRNNKIFKIK